MHCNKAKNKLTKVILVFTILISTAITLNVAFAESVDNYVINFTDAQLYSILSEMETDYYGHDYEDQGLKKRLARLEQTQFHYKRKNISLNQRVSDLYRIYKKKQTPFFKAKNKQSELSLSQMSLLALMESRLLGGEKPDMNVTDRLQKLELVILGTSRNGTIKERFDYLSKHTPINIKGIRITKNGQTIASFKPGYKQPPVPRSPHKDTYSPLNIIYNSEAGDYFPNVAKNSSREILRWKDFPIYVYVNSSNQVEADLTKLAVDYWKEKVPIRMTSNYGAANILVDWASRGNFVTVPIITREGGKKQIKILINMLEAKQTEDKDTHLVYLMHQLGHALGIWGHSDNPDDIMYPIGQRGIKDINISKKSTYYYQPVVLSKKVPKITDRDLNTLFRVYKNPTSIEKILAVW